MIQTLDPIIFRFTHGVVQVALYKRPIHMERYPGILSLPGGMVFEDKDNTLNDALNRIVDKKVGFMPHFLETMAPVGNKTRDPDGWSTTIPFLCITQDDGEHDTIEWMPVNRLLEQDSEAEYKLPFDHNALITKAYDVLRNRSTYSTLPLYFMQDKFTLVDLQACCETITGSPQNKAAFRRRWLKIGLFEPTDEMALPHSQTKANAKKSRSATLHKIHNYEMRFFERAMLGEKNAIAG